MRVDFIYQGKYASGANGLNLPLGKNVYEIRHKL